MFCVGTFNQIRKHDCWLQCAQLLLFIGIGIIQCVAFMSFVFSRCLLDIYLIAHICIGIICYGCIQDRSNSGLITSIFSMSRGPMECSFYSIKITLQ